jgi:hypothetical protein
VKRVELGDIRICKRCGRGRANLLTDGGDVFAIPLDPARARVLGAAATDVGLGWLSALIVERLQQDGNALQEIVLDLDGQALRALVSCRRGAELEVLSCTPQEGVEIATRAGIPLYATDEALAHATGAPAAPSGETLH